MDVNTEYDNTIDFLYNQLPVFQSLGPGAYKPGLDTAHLLDDAFGNAHKHFRSVHVAGTNGKGSTSHMMASVLMAQGYKVGLYTSPHLADFRERIRVNGEKISKAFVVDFVNRYKKMNLPCEPSFFELTTIMAFSYFASQNVDFAVIEVGLGGRLDTTNIISPVLSVITNISADHTSLLGSTPAEIAHEKAGIIKPGVPVVIGEAEGDVREVFEATAKDARAHIVFAEDSKINFLQKNHKFIYSADQNSEPCIECDLMGDVQPLNANTVMHALAALRNVGVEISDEAIRDGLANVQERTGLMGRWMKLSDNPETICDTGHNPGAWKYLAPRLADIAEEKEAHIVLGFANDKDVESIFGTLPKRAKYYFVEPGVKRARSAADLQELAKSFGLEGLAAGTVAQGFEMAKEACPRDGFIFIGGSNFVVAEILQA